MPRVYTSRQEHDLDCRVWVGAYEVKIYEVRRCKHGRLQIAGKRNSAWNHRPWNDLSPVFHPITYIRAVQALRWEAKDVQTQKADPEA